MLTIAEFMAACMFSYSLPGYDITPSMTVTPAASPVGTGPKARFKE